MVQLRSMDAHHGLGWQPDKPSFKDEPFLFQHLMRTEGIDQTVAPPPSAVAPGFFLAGIRDQGQTSACTGYSSARHWKLETGTPIDFSAMFPYYWARVTEGDPSQDNGAEIRDVFDGIAKHGVAHEHYWPSTTHDLLRIPTKTADKDAIKKLPLSYHRIGDSNDPIQIRAEILACIASGHSFVTGISCYDSLFTPQADQSGYIPKPQPSESLQGGHALNMGAYWLNGTFAQTPYGQRFTQLGIPIPQEVVAIANSWGLGVGQQGFYFIDLSYLTNRNLCDDTWTARTK